MKGIPAHSHIGKRFRDVFQFGVVQQPEIEPFAQILSPGSSPAPPNERRVPRSWRQRRRFDGA